MDSMNIPLAQNQEYNIENNRENRYIENSYIENRYMEKNRGLIEHTNTPTSTNPPASDDTEDTRDDIISEVDDLKISKLNHSRSWKSVLVFWYAVRTDNVELLDYIAPEIDMAKIEDPNSGGSPLHVGTAKNALKVVKRLVTKHNFDVNSSVLYIEKTPLHISAISGYRDMVLLLISLNSRVNKKTQGGCTALHLAATYGWDEIVDILIKNGADVNTASIHGSRPIISAAFKGYDKIVRLLISGGAERSATNKNDKTALHVAIEQGHKKVIQELMEGEPLEIN